VAKLPEAAALRAKAAKIRQALGPLMRNQKALSAQQKERATELLFEADELEAQADALLAGLRAAAAAAAARARPEVEVGQTLYPGVTVRFPGVSAAVDEALPGPLRVTTRTLHGETRVVVHYGRGRAAHPLPTRPEPDGYAQALRQLLTPTAPPAGR
jgi:hypothetical protein